MRGMRALTQLHGQHFYNSCQQALVPCCGEALQGSILCEQRHARTPFRTSVGALANKGPHGTASLPWFTQQRSIFGGFGIPDSRKFSQRRLVGWSPEQMYSVVSDVNEYHKFVPWCQKSVVSKCSDDGRSMEAELEVGFQLLVERYVSKVTLQRHRKVQSTVNNSMLFHHLDSTWSMEPGPSPGTCWLSFNVDFAFNSALYGHLADVFFSEVVQRMAGAFESRCASLYGPSSLLKLHQGGRLGHGRQQGQQQQGPGRAQPGQGRDKSSDACSAQHGSGQEPQRVQ